MVPNEKAYTIARRAAIDARQLVVRTPEPALARSRWIATHHRVLDRREPVGHRFRNGVDIPIANSCWKSVETALEGDLSWATQEQKNPHRQHHDKSGGLDPHQPRGHRVGPSPINRDSQSIVIFGG